MTTLRRSGPLRPLLLVALALSIPAFYLVLTGPSANIRGIGSLLYGVTAIIIAVEVVIHAKRSKRASSLWNESSLNVLIVIGALASAWPTTPPWSPAEWLLRLGLCSLIFIRLSMLLAKWFAPHNLFEILAVAVGLLAIAGAGFFWLEPTIRSYPDGLWLAFVTVATVGYGDLFPTSPASRIFAVFIVLLGYAVFSMVTAAIAAFFVGEDEKGFDKELYSDIRGLREEIAALRGELNHLKMAMKQNAPDVSGED